jgi:formyl-CoA transferase
MIKIESPRTGDPLRNWRMMKDGTSVWWQVQSRNKRSIAPDLRSPEDMSSSLRRLARIRCHRRGDGRRAASDWRAGSSAGAMWNLSWRYTCGTAWRNWCSDGALSPDANGGKSQVIDVALHEAVFNVMENLLPEYSAFGAVREAAGSALPGIAPSNAYRCADGYVLVAGNGDSIFKRLMTVIGRDDLGADPTLASNSGRAARVEELDKAIEAWSAERFVENVLEALTGAGVPAGRIYTAKDICEDSHYRERDMLLRQITRDGDEIEVPGIVPKLMGTPGSVRSSAPNLGDDIDNVLRQLGLSEQDIAALRQKGAIS